MTRANRRDFLHASVALGAGLGCSALPTPAPAAEKTAGEPRFKLGLVTYNTAAKWDLKTLLGVCRRVGIEAVECRTTHAHGVEPSLSAGERDRVKKQFADAGVVFWGSGSTCEFHSPDPAVVRKNIEECKRFVQLVADLGGRGVKVRPNGLPKEVPVEKTLEQIGKALVECGKAAADAGVEIWVEVHGRGTSEPPHMKTIMERCGHPSVGVCWNSNTTDLIDGGIGKAFAMLRPWLKSCHINQLYNDRLGKYPYRELFRLLRESGYDRYTLNESGWVPPDVRSGEEMLHYYKSLWEELARG
ncbi:MAG TPA: sugar phosphate isomerase/epimerase family protein [Gemmataceae bacterium]